MSSIISEIISIEQQAKDITAKGVEEKERLINKLNEFYKEADRLYKEKHEEAVAMLFKDFEAEKESIIKAFKEERDKRILETEGTLNKRLDSIVDSIFASIIRYTPAK